MVAGMRGKDGGRDSQGVWDEHGHTAVFNREKQRGPAGQHRELCSVSRGSLDGRGVWGRMDTCACMAEPLCCPPETITSLLIGYSPIGSFSKNKSVILSANDELCHLIEESVEPVGSYLHLTFPVVVLFQFILKFFFLPERKGGTQFLNRKSIEVRLL